MISTFLIYSIDVTTLVIIPLLDLLIAISNENQLHSPTLTLVANTFLNLLQSTLFLFCSPNDSLPFFYLILFSLALYSIAFGRSLYNLHSTKFPTTTPKSTFGISPLISILSTSYPTPFFPIYHSINEHITTQQLPLVYPLPQSRVTSPQTRNSKLSTELLFNLDDLLSPYTSSSPRIIKETPVRYELLSLPLSQIENQHGNAATCFENEIHSFPATKNQRDVVTKEVSIKTKTSFTNTLQTKPILSTLLALSSPTSADALSINSPSKINTALLPHLGIPSLLGFTFSFLLNFVNLTTSKRTSLLNMMKIVANFSCCVSLFALSMFKNPDFLLETPILYQNEYLILINAIVVSISFTMYILFLRQEIPNGNLESFHRLIKTNRPLQV